jgi:hypothetical protein
MNNTKQCRRTLKIEAEFPFETLINVYHAILHRDPSYRSRCSELAMRWTSRDSWFDSL